MKLLQKCKDGGPESTVTGWFLVEAKKLLSVAVLRFSDGSREAYHSHAFNCISWVLRGRLEEVHLDGHVVVHKPSWGPILTYRDTFHKVYSRGDTWVFTLRGPWVDEWREYLPNQGRFVTLTHGRRERDAN